MRDGSSMSKSSQNGPIGLYSPLLERAGFRHAFFTNSLDFAVSTGEALARAAGVLGVLPERVYFLSQVHGTAARVLAGEERREEVVRSIGDITLTITKGVAAGVRTADCVPVLVADRTSSAVAAIHSGWRGTVANVVHAGIAALRELTGGSGDWCAAVGPHIQRCCFEVGADVAAELERASTAGEAAVIRGERLRVDLRRIVRAQLEAEGVSREAIDDAVVRFSASLEPDERNVSGGVFN